MFDLPFKKGKRLVSRPEGRRTSLRLSVRQTQQGVHAVQVGGEGPEEVFERREESQ